MDNILEGWRPALDGNLPMPLPCTPAVHGREGLKIPMAPRVRSTGQEAQDRVRRLRRPQKSSLASLETPKIESGDPGDPKNLVRRLGRPQKSGLAIPETTKNQVWRTRKPQIDIKPSPNQPQTNHKPKPKVDHGRPWSTMIARLAGASAVFTHPPNSSPPQRI